MSTARANANQSLYLAKILLDGWRTALEDEAVPVLTLQRAFLPGVQAHLRQAYGWFLLEIVDLDPTPDSDPPANAAALPPVVEGTAVSGELRECGKLEQSGWLASLLATHSNSSAPQPRSSGNLASAASPAGDFAEVVEWSVQLEQMMSRMRDSLDEY